MDLILGMGEVGTALNELLTLRGFAVSGLDSIKSKCVGHPPDVPEILHVCIPGSFKKFNEIVLEHAKSGTQAVMIHSTVKPGTAEAVQKNTIIPIISSPTRGVHIRFVQDMTRYTKFVAADTTVDDALKRSIDARFVKTQWMSGTRVLELAKILTDTTYYGWLINYAQITKMICDTERVDYDELWTFAEEIQQYLGNRPKMYPGVIGGHCVIPNLDLLTYDQINTVANINQIYRSYLSERSNQ